MSSKYYVTTPVYYLNGPPHLGHAYTNIACDVLARFKRMQGCEVFFLTGTDEHGLKVAQKAKEEGVTPQAYVDELSAKFLQFNKKLRISNDDFIRTTSTSHMESTKKIWLRLRPYIYKGHYAGYYAVRDEAYYTEDELTPGPEDTRIAPTGAPVEYVEEETYFFRLSDFQERLIRYYESHPNAIGPRVRRNEVMQFLKGGLRDLSVSRPVQRLTWGIPVPGDSHHVMYVWVDALSNYLTAIGYNDPNSRRRHFWPADLHMIGKDILRFHAVYWPALLMALDVPLPHRIYAHGWWTVGGIKMSKSLGNVVDPLAMAQRFGRDAFRLYLLSGGPFSEDKDFQIDGIIALINNRLADAWGNLVHRTLSMVWRYCGGTLGSPEESPQDRELLEQVETSLERIRCYMNEQRFERVTEILWDLMAWGNRHVERTMPWKLAKDGEKKRLEGVLHTLLKLIGKVNLLLFPFVPDMAEQVGVMLDNPLRSPTFAKCWNISYVGKKVGQPEPLVDKFIKSC